MVFPIDTETFDGVEHVKDSCWLESSGEPQPFVDSPWPVTSTVGRGGGLSVSVDGVSTFSFFLAGDVDVLSVPESSTLLRRFVVGM